MDDFNASVAVVQRKISQIPLLTGDRRKTAIDEATREYQNAEQILKQNARNLTRPQYNQYESTLTNFKIELDRAKNPSGAFGGGYNASFGNDEEFQSKSQEQRQKLLYGVERLEATNQRLASTQRLANETEEIGVAVLGELQHQGDVLYRANEDLDIINDNMSRGRRIVLNMTRRVITNKIVLSIIIVLLLIVDAFIVYFKWIK
eukprot:TRINITY_DN3664_c0_g1_i1.p1 TRINITY_DN3664_c0_g1~~TRINITY_DN3664_c0_g1_i1.p1  ORF type:complete len:204 (-),score=56.23 TRINITY_DN3664_c0_g1_i1:143-754(-)